MDMQNDEDRYPDEEYGPEQRKTPEGQTPEHRGGSYGQRPEQGQGPEYGQPGGPEHWKAPEGQTPEQRGAHYGQQAGPGPQQKPYQPGLGPQQQPPQDVMQLLPADLKRLLDKELETLDKCRSMECDLLKEEVEAEKDYQKKLAAQAAARPAQAHSQEEIGRVLDWLKKQKTAYQDEEQKLNNALQAVETRITEQEDKIKRWKQEIDDLFKMLQALPGDVKKADDQVIQLQAQLDDAKQRGFQPKIDMLQQDLEAAKARQQRLKGQDKTLADAIDQALNAWRQARQALSHLKAGGAAGGQPSQEELQIEIKKVQKKLEYLKQHQDILVQRCLAV